MNVDHCWWKTALFYHFSLRFGINPLQPVRAWPTVFSVVPAGATHDLIPSRGNRVHLKVNGSPVKMEWIFSSVNYHRDGGERRVCWSEWCLMHSIPISSFLGSSFCVHHASSDQVFDSCRSTFIPHVISFLVFSFPSPLPLFMTPRWGGGGWNPDLTWLVQWTSSCFAASVLQSNPTMFSTNTSTQPHLPPGVVIRMPLSIKKNKKNHGISSKFQHFS